MNKVIDIFLFTHEFDLLELRLRALWPVVDKFILMEGDHNFTNKPKPMRFHEQAERFEWAKEKLIHLQHIGPFKEWEPDPLCLISSNGELFVEHQHRQYLYDTVKAMNFEPNDILLMSDVDEIPSREVIEMLRDSRIGGGPLLLKQDFYYYNIKCHRGKRWDGTIAMRFGNKDIKDVAKLRNKRTDMAYFGTGSGWHFAHFYDASGIREKLEHSSHQHYNLPEYYDEEHIKKCVAENKSYLGKKDGDLPPEPIPDYMMEELRRFPLMMGEAWK